MQLNNPFEIYGIHGIDMSGPEEQKIECPQIECRKRNKSYLKTLNVNTVKKIWHCYHCGWKGSAINEHLPDLSADLLPYNLEPITADSPIGEWFANRGISDIILEELGIVTGVARWKAAGGIIAPTIFFVNTMFDRVLGAKKRLFGDKKEFSQLKDAFKTFYNIQAAAGHETIIITEGEIDVATLYQCDIRNCISVPDGAPAPDSKNFNTKFAFLDNSLPFLHKVENFIIAVDTDAPGLKLREILANRIGKDRCSFVDYPADCKDLNDVLVKYGHDKVREVISNAKPYPLDGVFTARDLWNQVIDVYQNGYPEAQKLYIGDLDSYLKIRTKRLYVFTGIPNHGKSVFVDFILTKLMLQGWKSLIYSPETERVEHISRQIEQLTGTSFFKKTATTEVLETARDFLSDNCYYLLTEDRNMYIDEILEAAATYVMRFGVKILVVDPFNTVEYDLKDYSSDMNKYIGSVLDRLKYFAKKYDVTVIVVAHPHKMQKELTGDFKGHYQVPTLYNISDSQHWFNKPDVGVTIYRRFVGEGVYITEVYVQKIKHKTLGKVGNFELRFDIECERYYDLTKDKTNYLNDNTGDSRW